MTAVLTGAGQVVLAAGEVCDPLPFLRSRKSRKFMGMQDDLAVVAAGRALASAGLTSLGERAGLFLAVGYIPFHEDDIGPVLEASMTEDGAPDRRFDVRRFGAGGFQKAHPLLTFRCLPNMPAYHVSACFDVQGPYLVTYPGAAELYGMLEEAVFALESGAIDVALVGGVAAQSNFLVRHHFARITPPLHELRDVAAVLVLESRAHAGARARGALEAITSTYVPPDLATYATPPAATVEHLDGAPLEPGLGPAALAVGLARKLEAGHKGALQHELVSSAGIRASSTWVLS